MVNVCPAGLDPPAVARNRRKSTLKIRRILSSGFICQDLKIVLFTFYQGLMSLFVKITLNYLQLLYGLAFPSIFFGFS